MKGIYLASYEAFHPEFNLVYQDINGKRDIGGCMLDVDLSDYDYVIATPPCNFWSIARGNRCSQYSLDTKHLLPDIISKLQESDVKYWIVENVKNDKRFTEQGVFELCKCNIYKIGRHTYFTNIYFNDEELNRLNKMQRQDFKHHGKVIKYEDMRDTHHQGGYNVHIVIDEFLEKVVEDE